MVEEKEQCAMTTVSEEDLTSICDLFGYSLLAHEPVFGGYSATNFRVTLQCPEHECTRLLKILYHSASLVPIAAGAPSIPV